MLNPADSVFPTVRKLKKLKNSPIKFIKDSKAYLGAKRTAYATWAKFGSFALVLSASLLVVIYYAFMASPRYVSEAVFIIEQSKNNNVNIGSLAAFASASPTSKDAHIVKEFIGSRSLAEKLDKTLHIKSHYESSRWDWISRLHTEATAEEFILYYRDYIQVSYDEISGMLHLSVQSYEPEFSRNIAAEIIRQSEKFINQLGRKMANEQLEYARSEVNRTHSVFRKQQTELVKFQDENNLFNLEQQGGALVGAVNSLEANIVEQETELKALLIYMQEDASEVTSKRNQLLAMKKQLEHEKSRLANKDNESSLNNISSAYQETILNTELAKQLYANALAGLENVRSDAYQKLKHLLIIQSPFVAEEAEYPRRLYNIFTWFFSLITLYLLGRLIFAIVKEHAE